jgi:hypothetical protein
MLLGYENPGRPCEVDGCEGKAGIPGATTRWCSRHYYRVQRWGDPLGGRPELPAACSIEGCEKRRKARGWCGAHWLRWKQFGDPLHRKQGEIQNGCRICPRCQIDKPLSEWGKKSYCKECDRTRARQWRAAHPEWVNPQLPPAVQREAARRWRRQNPDKVRAQTALRRARKLAATVEVVSPAEIFARDDWTCQLCRESIDQDVVYPHPMSASLDHRVPLSRGGAHSKENCQASHLTCNIRKKDKSEAHCG